MSPLEQKTQHYQFNFNPKGFCVKDELFTHLNQYVVQFNSCYFIFLFINCSKQNKVRVSKVRGKHVRFEMSQIAPWTKGLGFLTTTISILTSSSLEDVEGEQECKHVASALDTTWLQTHGHKQLTVGKCSY